MLNWLQRPHTISAPRTNLHLDILMGRDETIDFSDVFLGESRILFLISFFNLFQRNGM